MAARVVQRMGQDDDFENFLLMHAMGANAAGQIASVVAGGVVLALLGAG
jgi:oxaloacetate decarboxylase beta subunit